MFRVSDSYIRLIPADKDWQPEPSASAMAIGYVTALFSDPLGEAEEIHGEFYDAVTLIDAGENTTGVTCSACGREIGVDWFYDLAEDVEFTFGSLDFEVPCCGATVSLDSLTYDWPIGFARYEICLMNPQREGYELDTDELATVARFLGHPVRQILAHY